VTRIAAAAGLALLAAGCGGGGSALSVANLGASNSTASNGSAPASAVPWARCMNAHGIPASADPGGYISIPPNARNSPQLQSAQKACRSLLPVIDQGGGGPRSTPQEGRKMLAFARCMRSHGVPAFPDPKFVNGLWTPEPPSGVDPNAPQFQSAQQTCQKIAPFGRQQHR
jgi:hypothetical protein